MGRVARQKLLYFLQPFPLLYLCCTHSLTLINRTCARKHMHSPATLAAALRCSHSFAPPTHTRSRLLARSFTHSSDHSFTHRHSECARVGEGAPEVEGEGEGEEQEGRREGRRTRGREEKRVCLLVSER